MTRASESLAFVAREHHFADNVTLIFLAVTTSNISPWVLKAISPNRTWYRHSQSSNDETFSFQSPSFYSSSSLSFRTLISISQIIPELFLWSESSTQVQFFTVIIVCAVGFLELFRSHWFIGDMTTDSLSLAITMSSLCFQLNTLYFRIKNQQPKTMTHSGEYLFGIMLQHQKQDKRVFHNWFKK